MIADGVSAISNFGDKMENNHNDNSNGQPNPIIKDEDLSSDIEENLEKLTLEDVMENKTIDDQDQTAEEISKDVFNPFMLFPEETWEDVVDKLEDSKDIENVFKAFPELEGFVLPNRYYWLIDQVIPFIHLWLNKKELLTCRQICKRWCRGVDNYLEHHPFRRAFDEHHGQTTGQVWFPEDSSEYDSRKWRDFYNFKYFDAKRTELFTEFFRETDAYRATGRNPFVGRLVQFHDYGLWSINDFVRGVFPSIQAYWDGAVEVLRKFGDRIWFLKLRNVSGEQLRFSQTLLDSLCLLPNLKSLLIHVQFEFRVDSKKKSAKKSLESRRGSLPPLPQLETLEFLNANVVTETLANLLISQYSTQIRRLDIHHLCWKREYSELFPNLTEFRLSDTHTKQSITDIICFLNAPKLVMLHLEVCTYQRGCVVSANDLLLWLKRFPRIRRFELMLQNGRLQDSDEDEASAEHISSLKSLHILQTGHYVRLRFLHLLPSLEYLKITSIHERFGLDFMTYENEILYDQQLWETLPKLKEITLANGQEFKGDRFPFKHLTRARYEWLKKGNTLPSDKLEYEPSWSQTLKKLISENFSIPKVVRVKECIPDEK